MSKVLVTGVFGFIGGHLAERLLKEGHEVYGIDDASGGKEYDVPGYVKYDKFDLRDAKLTDEFIRDIKPEVVFHLAANAAENKAQFSPIDITSRNYSAFINTLTPFIKYGGKRFIFTSSIAVYGKECEGVTGTIPFRETMRPDPEDLYGITKYAAEQTLKVMSKVHGFEYVIARPHNVYGPRQNMTDPYRNVVTIWMNALLQGKPYYIYGDGEQKRCFSYIDDVVEALYKCGFDDVSGKTFNVGADQPYTLNELNEAILKATGSNVKAVYLDERPQEVREAISDHSEAKKYLNYADKTSLEEGIRKTWEWVKSVGYKEPVYTKLEIDSDKVPLNWRTHL